MLAVPRWSHRDPVEHGNPFPAGDLRYVRWEEATTLARAALQRYDDEIAASVADAPTSESYARRWLDLATMRFDTWARRGLAAVDNAAALREYATWRETYIANWRVYVAETCPHVAPNIRRRLGLRLAARATHWNNKAAQRLSKHAPPDTATRVDGR